MPHANTTDEFWIDAGPDRVYEALLDPGAGWWPRARARVENGRIVVRARAFRRLSTPVSFEARVDGLRPSEGLTWWFERGELRGRGEWWLESFKTGTIVHFFLDVDPGDRGRVRRWSSRVRRYRWAIRRGVNALKDRLEGRR